MLIKNFDAKTFDETKHCCACGACLAPFKCSTGQFCEKHKRYAAETMRWVVSYVKRFPYEENDGSDAVWNERRLMEGCQGRYTYETREIAQARLDGITSNNEDWRLEEIWGKDPDFKVIKCPCWPVHFDPKRSIFDAS